MQILKNTRMRNAASKLKAVKFRTVQGVAALAIFGGLMGNVVWDFWEDRPLSPSDPRYLDKDRLTRLSERGDAEAQYQLGNLYFAGHTVKASEKDAIHWYSMAAKQGHPLAQYQLGLVLQLKDDDEGALTWLRKAAEQNVIDAQNRVGNLYIKGTPSTASNGAIAAKYFASAAEQGNSSAMHNLAHLLKNGAGIPQDTAGALFWMKLATQTERDLKVRAQMMTTLTEWEQASSQEELAAATQAAAQRFAKGFTQKPVTTSLKQASSEESK